MKNTNKTMAIVLLMAVLFAGGLSLVSVQKVMAQGIPEDKPDGSDQNKSDQADEREHFEQTDEPEPNEKATAN